MIDLHQDIPFFDFYKRGNDFLERKSFKPAIDCFDIVLDRLDYHKVKQELIAKTLFSSQDGSITFTVMDIYHKRGFAKFSISDISSIDDFTKAIKLSKSYGDSYYMRGVARFILDNDWKSALPDIKKYLTLNPDDKGGNDMLYVLEEIKNNSSKVYKCFKKSKEFYQKSQDYTPPPSQIRWSISVGTAPSNERWGVRKDFIIKAIENLDKAINLFTQKNRPYIYQKSHSFTLLDIYFMKIKCKLKFSEYDQAIKEKGAWKTGFDASSKENLNEIKENLNEMADLSSKIYNMSNGAFKPPQDELGEELYYSIIKHLKKK